MTVPGEARSVGSGRQGQPGVRQAAPLTAAAAAAGVSHAGDPAHAVAGPRGAVGRHLSIRSTGPITTATANTPTCAGPRGLSRCVTASHGWRRTAARLSAVLILAGAFALPAAAPAWAAGPGNSALDWAEAHAAGCWYHGGTTCNPGYDCSGRVSSAVWAADHIWLGRTTSDMLASGKLRRDYTPARGNLAFSYGGSHVEVVTKWRHVTYGAHSAGTRVGYLHWGSSWPSGTVFYAIRP